MDREQESNGTSEILSQFMPRELMPIYRDEILPLADVLTPNCFELRFGFSLGYWKLYLIFFSELAGVPVENEADCLRAVDVLHARGVKR